MRSRPGASLLMLVAPVVGDIGVTRDCQRLKPQSGITCFVVGSGGKIRQGDIDPNSGLTASGFDMDLAFMVAEIVGDRMYFNAMSRTGLTVDSGVVARRQ